MSEAEAVKKAAFKKGTFNKEKAELSFKVNNATGKALRLVHDGKTVIAIIEGTAKTITSTLHTIEEFATKKHAEDRIKELGLQYTKEVGYE